MQFIYKYPSGFPDQDGPTEKDTRVDTTVMAPARGGGGPGDLPGEGTAFPPVLARSAYLAFQELIIHSMPGG